jgi:hypothetical protein
MLDFRKKCKLPVQTKETTQMLCTVSIASAFPSPFALVGIPQFSYFKVLVTLKSIHYLLKDSSRKEIERIYL